MNRVLFILGTRPEIIKISPLLRAANAEGIPFDLLHTNQHYSAELDAIFFNELSLDPPRYNLNVGTGTQTEQTARMMVGIEKALLEVPTSWVVVQGDTNSGLAGALAAAKLNIPIGHVEAGLRSNDRLMPEETNRVIIDHISTLLFPPTTECATNIFAEGIAKEKVLVVGNTVVDSVLQNKAFCPPDTLSRLGLTEKNYYLLTLHRPSNVDTAEDLSAIFSALEALSIKTGIHFFFPIHPRTESAIKRFKLTIPKTITVHPPVGYFEFLALEQHAVAIITDSGGLQEEGCILGTPCLTLRETTERPETVQVGANKLVKRNLASLEAALAHFNQQPTWENPFGDGTASEKIMQALVDHSQRDDRPR
jgi:UDP-N-acetylglucosamine 2-epimerase (non-hydrolysing)